MRDMKANFFNNRVTDIIIHECNQLFHNELETQCKLH